MILNGRTALVTGSTSGIGLAIARALAAEGARLMINGFGNADEIARECEELGAVHDGADMSRPDEIERMMKRCADELGAPDILVTMPASSMSHRSRNSRRRNGTRSSPSTCRRRSTPRGSRSPP